jgi:hypothetical protein
VFRFSCCFQTSCPHTRIVWESDGPDGIGRRCGFQLTDHGKQPNAPTKTAIPA